VIAETNRRHLASNKLAKRTSKKVAGACERWPSWSLFSGATRGEGLVKRCPDALSLAHEATEWVKVPGRCYKHWLAVGTSKGGSVACPAHRHSLEGAALTTGAYEGSLFAEGVSVRFKVSPFHGAALAAGSVVFLGLELHSLHQKERGAAWVRRRPHPLGSKEVDDGGIRGSIALSPWEENAHASAGVRLVRPLEDLRSSAIHRSVHRGVKPRSTLGPPSLRRGRRRVVPQSPAADIPRTHEMRVFVSTVWMAEVGP